MLTFSEISDMCQTHKIDLTIVTTRNYAGSIPWQFHVTAEYDDAGTRVQCRQINEDLAEAVNAAFAGLHRISREGFKFPIMLADQGVAK